MALRIAALALRNVAQPHTPLQLNSISLRGLSTTLASTAAANKDEVCIGANYFEGGSDPVIKPDEEVRF